MHKLSGITSSNYSTLQLLVFVLQELQLGVSEDEAIDWLQQWGTTIAFGCEVPFPAPLQCDRVEDGVRIGVISTAGGSVSLLGEIFLEIDADRLESDEMVSIAVTRVSKAPDVPLPGERELLRTLRHAIKYVSKNQRGWLHRLCSCRCPVEFTFLFLCIVSCKLK
jgi:hypothetical protein